LRSSALHDSSDGHGESGTAPLMGAGEPEAVSYGAATSPETPAYEPATALGEFGFLDDTAEAPADANNGDTVIAGLAHDDMIAAAQAEATVAPAEVAPPAPPVEVTPPAPSRPRLEDITDFDSLITLPERPGRRAPAPAAPTAPPARGSTFGRPQRTLGSLLNDGDQPTAPENGRTRLSEAQAQARREANLLDEAARSADDDAMAGSPSYAPTTDESGPGADGEAIESDEPLNRGLLLKFLSSVRN
jgi:hypothetical protein